MNELTTSLPPPAPAAADTDEVGDGDGVRGRAEASRTHELEQLYRAAVGPVTAYFARRTHDPQLAADLTADTFAAAITSFASYRPALGSARGWVFGIARHVHARHLEAARRDRDAVARLHGFRALDRDETAELLDRIDAERHGRAQLERLSDRPTAEREVAELVLLADLTPREAAAALGITAGAARVRLLRARRALRAHPPTDDPTRPSTERTTR